MPTCSVSSTMTRLGVLVLSRSSSSAEQKASGPAFTAMRSGSGSSGSMERARSMAKSSSGRPSPTEAASANQRSGARAGGGANRERASTMTTLPLESETIGWTTMLSSAPVSACSMRSRTAESNTVPGRTTLATKADRARAVSLDPPSRPCPRVPAAATWHGPSNSAVHEANSMAAPIMLETKCARPAKLASSAVPKADASLEVIFSTPTRSSPLRSGTQIIDKIPSSAASFASTRGSLVASLQRWVTPLWIARPERLSATDSTEPTESATFPLAAVMTREAVRLAYSSITAPSAEGTRTSASASTRSMTLAGSLAIAIASRSPIVAPSYIRGMSQCSGWDA